jgi:tetratricopeptide (TPR) repeat protein
MPRFNSLKHDLSETRHVLRQRFARNLPASDSKMPKIQPSGAVSDESALKLLLELNIQFENEEANACAFYNKLRSEYPEAPCFDDLSTLGWIRLSWGRLHAAYDNEALRHTNKDTKEAVGRLLSQRHKRSLKVESDVVQDPSLADVLAVMKDTPDDFHFIKCSSPEWVNARLWERAPDCGSTANRLRFWVDRVNLLGNLESFSAWNPNNRDVFYQAAFEVLTSDSGFLSWENSRNRLIARAILKSTRKDSDSDFSGLHHPKLRNTHSEPNSKENQTIGVDISIKRVCLDSSEIDSRLPAVPTTIIDRYEWLDTRQRWGGLHDEYDACSDFFLITKVLLHDVEDADYSAYPHPVSQKLFDLAVERPELLEFITLMIQQTPILMADLLLDPRLSTLACVLIVTWSTGSGVSDRDLQERDYKSSKLVAFTDAISISCHFAEKGSLAKKDLASFLSWLHREAERRFLEGREPLVSDQMLGIVRAELARLSADCLIAVYNAFAPSTSETKLGKYSFAAALDVVSIGMIADHIAPEMLVTFYIKSIREGDISLSTAELTSMNARTLVQLARRCNKECTNDFLYPLNVADALAEGSKNNENPFTLEFRISRSIREHIRTLCRAVSAWEDSPPPELLDALVKTIYCGALSHPQKNRVDALSARHETSPFGNPNSRPLAADLGEALTALLDNDRERLLTAILETDEPLILAQLISTAPPLIQDLIRRRISALTPDKAGETFGITETWARIEALLSIGDEKTLASYIEREKVRIERLGPEPTLTSAYLQMNLRLHLLREEFDEIAKMDLPEGLNQREESNAQDTIIFYKAVAEIQKPDGDLNAAEKSFFQLHRKRPDITSYGLNLLAVRVSLLLTKNLFGQLRGKDAKSARVALNDAESAMRCWPHIGDDDLARHNCNRALLFLAIGHPEIAHMLLDEIDSLKQNDRVIAYTAVALARMGRNTEALNSLEQATKLSRKTDLLKSAEAQILRGVPFVQRVEATITDDSIQRIRDALADLKNMDPIWQAKILSVSSNAFEDLVIGQVRAATASIVELVPMMKFTLIDSCEDDITAIVRELLTARLNRFINWYVSDQSKGGFSEIENPGERDLVIKKDSSVLTVIEAVISKGTNKTDLSKHFRKLFSYSTCRLFFHLTYSYSPEPGKVMEILKAIARDEAPKGFQFQNLEDIPIPGSGPPEFRATYSSQMGNVKVVFLLLDLQQQDQRDARKAPLRTPKK